MLLTRACCPRTSPLTVGSTQHGEAPKEYNTTTEL